MGRKASEWHRLSNVDPAARVGTCSVCGPVRVKANRVHRGRVQWRCRNAIRVKPSEIRHRDKARAKWTGRGYRIHLTDRCDRCGFSAEHPCQLDVDHIDGDHQNNAPENLQTLCANCHRLKTNLERMPAALRAIRWPNFSPRASSSGGNYPLDNGRIVRETLLVRGGSAARRRRNYRT